MAFQPAVANFTRYVRYGLILLAIVLIAGGCSKSAKETYCDDRDELRESVDDLNSSVSSLDRNKIEDSANKVRADMDDLEQSAQKVNGPSVTDLESDFEELVAAIQSVGQGGGDVTANIQAIEAPLAEFSRTLSSFVQAYSCD